MNRRHIISVLVENHFGVLAQALQFLHRVAQDRNLRLAEEGQPGFEVGKRFVDHGVAGLRLRLWHEWRILQRSGLLPAGQENDIPRASSRLAPCHKYRI